jgi:2-succinyl-5-enolpyruvyl-6-hydroxy-3-cyclohexene-1-carboxylate synthase
LVKDLSGDKFFAAVKSSHQVLDALVQTDFPSARRGIIVVGPADGGFSPADVGVLAGLAKDLGWPVLADGLSGLRGSAGHFPNLVTHYDAMVRSAKTGRRLKPEVVLCVGGWPTSKPLRSWLEKHGPETWMITAGIDNLDALHLATRHVRCSLAAFAGSVVVTARRPAAYAALWQRAETAAGQGMRRGLAAAHARFEGGAVLTLARHLPALTPVFVANSMPVRDVEYFWPAGDQAHRIHFNRGANGIDGTLSTALGLAQGSRQPAVLLTGDLALLHDTNGFLSAPKFRGGLTVVLINNDGGGIFEHLPVAQFNPPFEEFFATPQHIDFKKLCATYGVSHVMVRDWKQLAGLVARLPKRGIRVLEIRTDRRRDAAFRKQLFAAVAQVAERA